MNSIEDPNYIYLKSFHLELNYNRQISSQKGFTVLPLNQLEIQKVSEAQNPRYENNYCLWD